VRCIALKDLDRLLNSHYTHLDFLKPRLERHILLDHRFIGFRSAGTQALEFSTGKCQLEELGNV